MLISKDLDHHQMNKLIKKTSLPLRRFSWSKNKEKTESQKLIEKTAIEWFDAKHSRPSQEETNFINSNCNSSCPYCGNKGTNKDGKTAAGLQRFVCPMCGKRFNALTGTIFDSKKIPISEWMEFLLHLFEFHTVRSSSFDNRNANSTGEYWLEKVFLVLKNIQNDIVLDKTVYCDEIFFSLVKRQVAKVNGKSLRGISRNKICVVSATNKKESFFFATNTSKLNEAEALRFYSMHIKEGTFLIHDKEKSHNIVIEKLHLKHIAYDSNDLKKLPDELNPLNPINELHRLLNQFMTARGGFNRSNLQDWLNLFWFTMNGPKDRYDNVLLFIEMALKQRKMIRYRDYYLKNTD